MAKTNYVQLEFYKRYMKSKYDNNNKKKVNTLKSLLREHELKRFENEVAVELQNLGVNVMTCQILSAKQQH